ncbi:abortive infection family protein [Burkholderia gladioli]|uniref:abortive infection family protein n=1 Tax=Burkholderia gladioli TaxID=28095 RepID=UPI00163FA67B|nr:abortive infection family protein [Burkholderia gladioli]
MDNKIKTLAALGRQVAAKQTTVQDRARQLASDLSEAFADTSVRARSNTVLLEKRMANDPFPMRGYLFLANGQISVVSGRHTTLATSWLPDAEVQNQVDSTSLVDCPPLWLEHLLTEATLSSLFANIEEQLVNRNAGLESALTALRRALSDESAAIDAEMAETLADSKTSNLSRLWQEAVDASHIDSADALTRCSRFLEAVCAKILRERGVALPKDKSMSPLVKACLEVLTWPSEKEAEADVRQLLGGIQSITNGIGALRTHFGTAHGATSHLPPLDRGYAVFVKQATVAAATFLLDRHQASLVTASELDDPPAA